MYTTRNKCNNILHVTNAIIKNAISSKPPKTQSFNYALKPVLLYGITAMIIGVKVQYGNTNRTAQ